MSGLDATAVKGVARPFMPTDLADCILWLRADLGVTLTAGKVSAWADQSSNARSFVQATAGARPVPTTLSGQQAALEFDGGDALGCASWPLPAATEQTIFVVAKRATMAAAGYLLDTYPNGVSRPEALYWAPNVGVGNPGYAFLVEGAQAGTGFDIYYNSDVTNPHVLCVTQTTEQRSLIVDGAAQYTEVLDQDNMEILTLNVGGSISGGWKGEIAEYVWFSRILTLGEIETMESYLGGRYSVSMS